ncbi:MAG: hypothetical protein EG826_16060 [Deltaproteobacteria bacterium]|nr:hypothetical protein [Deltaproteobacteria bacterium]
MRRIMTIAFIGMLILTAAGCAASGKIIKQKAQSERTDIFTEIGNHNESQQGFAVLNIKATIKTHLEGYYFLESQELMCGKRDYPILINISGQARTWRLEGEKEALPRYGGDGSTSLDPDAGEGVKYVLEKKLRMPVGAHKVFIGLPNEEYFKEVIIDLREGKTQALEFRPIYKYKTHPVRIPTFMRGIEKFAVYLNGESLE